MKPRFIYLSLFIVVFTANPVTAQIGIGAGYKSLNAKGWQENFERKAIVNPYPMDGWQVEIQYHLFGAKRKRIEFYPQLFFSKFEAMFERIAGQLPVFNPNSVQHVQIGLLFNTRIYFFDIKCNIKCDTIDGPQLNFIKKNLYLEASPILLRRTNIEELSGRKFMSNSYTGGVSIGVGIDLPISSRFNLSPILQFSYYPSYSKWTNYILNIQSDLKQMFIGCQLEYDL